MSSGGAQYTRSQSFGMLNGLKQGSVISPYLLNVYLDELIYKILQSKIGCSIGDAPMNLFAYAGDLAVVAPTARALNKLLEVCQNFASEHFIIYSVSKTVCMVIPSKGVKWWSPPNFYLDGVVLEYVESFIYLGHFIKNDLTDDDDLLREVRSLSVRGNILIMKFSFCTFIVMCCLFKNSRYSLYCSALWSNSRPTTLYRLKVCYSNIMWLLIGVPRWQSDRNMFVTLRIRSFDEIRRYVSFSCPKLLCGSVNS